MSKFTKMFEDFKKSRDYTQSGRGMQYVCNVLERGGAKSLSKAEADEIKSFSISEMRRLIAAIPNAENYKEKDAMFFYEDGLLGAFTLANGGAKGITEDELDVISQLVTLVRCERVLENAVDDMFQLEKIEKANIDEVLKIVKPIKDTYRRGLLYSGLHAYAKDLNKLTPEAKTALSEFVAAELEGMLKKADKLNEDELTALEYAADVCKHFADYKLLDVLARVLEVKNSAVRYYAIDTLLGKKREVPASVVLEMAQDLTYWELTYNKLVECGKLPALPAEYTAPEYLAKSDMVHWLIYPTELNKEPDEIELLGTVTKKKCQYFVFRYKSDSDNLGDELKGKWLIGWALGDGGGTFSNFDLLSDYEKKNTAKTLKHIAKKLL